MVSLFIFTSSLNRKLVLRNCSHVSSFIFLANVWVEVKTSCQNMFRVFLRSLKRNNQIMAHAVKSDQKEANLVQVSISTWHCYGEIFLSMIFLKTLWII